MTFTMNDSRMADMTLDDSVAFEEPAPPAGVVARCDSHNYAQLSESTRDCLDRETVNRGIDALNEYMLNSRELSDAQYEVDLLCRHNNRHSHDHHEGCSAVGVGLLAGGLLRQGAEGVERDA